MSIHYKNKKYTINTIKKLKNHKKIVALTAFTSYMAELMDPIVDMIIVGDSVGMVAYGHDSTLMVTIDMIIAHGNAVVRGANKALVVVDMPFGTHEESKEVAFRNARRIISETGADAVKIEVGAETLDTISFLIARGIPVLPHIGLRPQQINVLGGFKTQGKADDEVDKLVKEAKALEKAGAFAVLIEGVYEHAAVEITKSLQIPSIGIGASMQCDGQVLVTEDLLGLNKAFKPRFVKQYADLSRSISDAFTDYARDVESNQFPTKNHCYLSDPTRC
ncbi:3-methyl-2-oxobutanoate hydroxymethyltransferase [Vibrio sp. S4M6]|uniref:3-methyl-2-oxobutanoate hydroxymethyltransferase n=1 Tax=Vibrio sinus TaxID=2946865 RepID=UPI00202AB7CD|nr:3-methyl-2-oxobutanoate hydroxymethyltransferase [Vibrio sinus]MCL9780633.1 3-methyl-2-oxobutanoate hydroxymethyltransferase [Vibrio sinus]